MSFSISILSYLLVVELDLPSISLGGTK
uniref:Uncharacterized protein n=1 Tax=Arundo donax TaxID=35708 RepID=A0A0A8ZM03_ARUDO